MIWATENRRSAVEMASLPMNGCKIFASLGFYVA